MDAVVCGQCQAVFRSRSWWAILVGVHAARKACPKCLAAGPFRDASASERAAEGKRVRGTVLLEIFFVVLIIVMFAVK